VFAIDFPREIFYKDPCQLIERERENDFLDLTENLLFDRRICNNKSLTVTCSSDSEE